MPFECARIIFTLILRFTAAILMPKEWSGCAKGEHLQLLWQREEKKKAMVCFGYRFQVNPYGKEGYGSTSSKLLKSASTSWDKLDMTYRCFLWFRWIWDGGVREILDHLENLERLEAWVFALWQRLKVILTVRRHLLVLHGLELWYFLLVVSDGQSRYEAFRIVLWDMNGLLDYYDSS